MRRMVASKAAGGIVVRPAGELGRLLEAYRADAALDSTKLTSAKRVASA